MALRAYFGLFCAFVASLFAGCGPMIHSHGIKDIGGEIIKNEERKSAAKDLYEKFNVYAFRKDICDLRRELECFSKTADKLVAIESALLPSKFKKEYCLEIPEDDEELKIKNNPKRRLENLLKKARKELDIKAEYSEEDAVKVLEDIYDLLKGGVNGMSILSDAFSIESGDGKSFKGINITYLSEGLSKLVLDPDTASLLYYHIAQDIGLSEISLVENRYDGNASYVFVRFTLDSGKKIDWNPTIGKRLDDVKAPEMIQMYYKNAVKGHKSLKNITEKELLSSHYVNIGCVWANLKNIYSGDYMDHEKKAIDCFDEALKVDPSNADAYVQKGSVLLGQAKIDSAFENFKKAIELNKDYADELNFIMEKVKKDRKNGGYVITKPDGVRIIVTETSTSVERFR